MTSNKTDIARLSEISFFLGLAIGLSTGMLLVMWYIHFFGVPHG